jgi:hypothetical protein
MPTGPGDNGHKDHSDSGLFGVELFGAAVLFDLVLAGIVLLAEISGHHLLQAAKVRRQAEIVGLQPLVKRLVGEVVLSAGELLVERRIGHVKSGRRDYFDQLPTGVHIQHGIDFHGELEIAAAGHRYWNLKMMRGKFLKYCPSSYQTYCKV